MSWRRPAVASLGTATALFGLWGSTCQQDKKRAAEPPARWTWNVGAFCLSKDDPVQELAGSDYLRRVKLLNGHCCGEDSFALAENKNQIVMAIADGVGGWRKRGIDPAQFSRCLMEQVRILVDKASSGFLNSEEILRKAFYGLVQVYLKKEGEPFGSSTACIVSLQKRTGLLDVTNLGDSGLLVVRDGRAIFRTEVQQTRFNAPYQTTLRPNGDVDDMTHMAAQTVIPVQHGDILLLATDGLWDNLWEHNLLDMLVSRLDASSSSRGVSRGDLEHLAKDLVMEARAAAASDKDSPFAVESKRHGKNYSGGKPDDITVLVSVISDTFAVQEPQE